MEGLFDKWDCMNCKEHFYVTKDRDQPFMCSYCGDKRLIKLKFNLKELNNDNGLYKTWLNISKYFEK